MYVINLKSRTNKIQVRHISKSLKLTHVGQRGLQGVPGEGVPNGGNTGQVLAKNSNTDYDTEWVNQSGSGGGAVDSVFGRAGVVVAEDNDYDDTQIAVDDTDISAASGGFVTGSTVHAIFLSIVTNLVTFGGVLTSLVSEAFNKVHDTLDDITAGVTNKHFTATDETKLDGIEAGADVTDATNVDAAGATMNSDTSLVGNGYFLDEDNMASNSATKVPSQQSVKAYVDSQSGGGAVDSVNSQIGVVVLDQDDIGDGTTYKQYSATEKTKLAGVATGATANDTDANLKNRANHTGTQTASTISDFSTAADARITAATGISVQAYNANLTTWAGKTAPSGTVVGASDSQTLTNKRITQRVDTIAGSSSPQTRSIDNFDQMEMTGISVAMTIGAPIGTPTSGQLYSIRLKDNGTARALTWNAAWRSVGSNLPTTTVLGKTIYLLFRYNSTDSVWDLISTALEGNASVGETAAQTLTNKTLTSPVINTPTGIVKGDVGLGNVDNTSDANKPVSTAQNAAILASMRAPQVMKNQRYKAPITQPVTTTTSVLTAGRCYFHAFAIPSTGITTLTDLFFEVTGGWAGNARLGVFKITDGKDPENGVTLVADLGNVDLTVAAQKYLSGISQVINDEWCLIGLYVHSATPIFRALNAIGHAGTSSFQQTGYHSDSAYIQYRPITGYAVSSIDYSAGMPSSIGALTIIAGGANPSPLIAAKFSY